MSIVLYYGHMTDSSPGERVATEKATQHARLADIATRLAAARAAEAAVYAELEAAVIEAEPVLGATGVVRASGLSRARVYQIIPKKGDSA